MADALSPILDNFSDLRLQGVAVDFVEGTRQVAMLVRVSSGPVVDLNPPNIEPAVFEALQYVAPQLRATQAIPEERMHDFSEIIERVWEHITDPDYQFSTRVEDTMHTGIIK